MHGKTHAGLLQRHLRIRGTVELLRSPVVLCGLENETHGTVLSRESGRPGQEQGTGTPAPAIFPSEREERLG
jgi:hypothetical protein